MSNLIKKSKLKSIIQKKILMPIKKPIVVELPIKKNYTFKIKHSKKIYILCENCKKYSLDIRFENHECKYSNLKSSPSPS